MNRNRDNGSKSKAKLPLIGSVDEFNPAKEEWVNYRKRIDIMVQSE